MTLQRRLARRMDRARPHRLLLCGDEDPAAVQQQVRKMFPRGAYWQPMENGKLVIAERRPGQTAHSAVRQHG